MFDWLENPNNDISVRTLLKNVRNQRREEIMNCVKNAGEGNVPIVELSTKYQVSQMTIYRDIDWCIGQIPLPKAAKEAIKIFNSYDQIRNKAHRMMLSPDMKTSEKGAQLLLQTNAELLKFLENRGLLQKVAEKHVIAGALAHVDIKTALKVMFGEPDGT